SSSDHSALLLDMGLPKLKRQSRFHFDKRWIGIEGFEETVTKVWQIPVTGTHFFQLKEKIKHTRIALLIWTLSFQSQNQALIATLTQEMENLNNDKTGDNWDKWEATKRALNKAHLQEELFWQQKSRLRWLKEGDANTFFHTITLQRRRHNAITRLLTSQGRILSSQVDMERHISEFYSHLFSSEKYKLFTGQSVNLQKSAIFFSRNTPQPLQSSICSGLNGIVCHRSTKYLGLSLGIGRSKKEVLDYVLNSIRNNLQGWQTKFLSPAGKEVLLKAVIQALPIFS
ncbi:Unknown protein, partial [Striga hermonthica]